MPCHWMKIGDTVVHVRTSGQRKRKSCHYCGVMAEYQCDFPVSKKRNGKWKTCDLDLCSSCTQKGVSADVDFCKEHYEPAKAAYNRRKQD